MSKKNIIIISSILVIIIVIASLYGTFATNSTVDSTSSATYSVTLTNSTSEVTVPANSSKTIYYKLNNTNNGTVKYGVAYSGTNITVKVYSDSNDPETGLINYGENKFIKLYVQNTGSSESTATITTVLGYENGGNLIVPSGKTLVTETCIGNAAKYITNLYKNATKTVVTNNSITYNYATSVNLMNDRLGGTTTSLDGGNIRYYGASPNNYVYFNCGTYPSTNCELWRIIGVFDGKLKLIRKESIGNYSWDTSASTVNSGNGINEWSQADIMKLLNPGYTGTGGSLYYNSGSGSCYSGQSNATTACNFTSTGLKNDITRSMISDSTWYTGGWNTNAVYSNQIYEKEREIKVINSPSDGVTRTTKWTGKIGLMYPSDYGYATDFIKCNLALGSYNGSTNSYVCRSNDWIYNGTSQWALNPYTSNAYGVWRLLSDGGVSHYDYPGRGYTIRPVVHLNSDVVMVSGSGTEGNPYKISA